MGLIGDHPTHREKQKRLFTIQLKISPCYLLCRSCLCINIFVKGEWIDRVQIFVVLTFEYFEACQSVEG